MVSHVVGFMEMVVIRSLRMRCSHHRRKPDGYGGFVCDGDVKNGGCPSAYLGNIRGRYMYSPSLQLINWHANCINPIQMYFSALHWACYRGRLSVVQFLLAHGAETDIVDKSRHRPKGVETTLTVTI